MPNYEYSPVYEGGKLKWWYNHDSGEFFEPYCLISDRPLSAELQLKQWHEHALNAKTHSICYFIAGESGPVKIGHSVAPRDRLKTMQSHCPVALNILATSAGGAEMEAYYHHVFNNVRLHGEWFDRTPELLAEIDRINEASPTQLAGGVA